MNTAFQCVILLAIAAFCSPATIKKCQCLTLSRAVNVSLVADVIEYGPRPTCKRREVIVTMKDETLRCLDPNEEFSKRLLRFMRLRKEALAAKMNTTRANTTIAPTTVSTTVAPTSS